MSVIFSGNFAENFGAPDYHSTAATGRDATMTDAQVAFPQVGQHQIGWLLNIASSTNLWFHWRMHAVQLFDVSTYQTISTPDLLRLDAGGTLARITIPGFSSGTAPLRATSSVGGSETHGTSWFPAADTTYTFDVNVRWVSTSLTIEVYVNGGLVSTASRTGTVANFSAFWISNAYGRRLTGSNPIYLSELLIASASTIGARVQTIRPSAAGQYAQWTGSPGNVNDFNPVTGIAAPTSGLIASRVHTAALSGTVRAVQPWGYHLGLTPPRVSPMFRIGSTDYFTASPVAPGANNAPQSIVTSVFATNPATGNPWTASDLAAIDAGFRSEGAA
jgi:hypothetical protein